MREFLKNPGLETKISREEGTEKEAERLESDFKAVKKTVEKVADEAVEMLVMTENDEKLIHGFDGDLEAIEKMHVGFNHVFRCRHPEFGEVVLKVPSTQEEIEFFKRANNVPGIAKFIKSYDVHGRTALLTRFIDGSNLIKIEHGLNGWKNENGTISHEGKEITSEAEIISKLKTTVRSLHDSFDLACFDIRPINVILDKQGNPYLFDFDIQFGSSRGKELRKWILETITYPIEVAAEKTLSSPLAAMFELIIEQNTEGFEEWLTEGPTRSFPGSGFKKFRKRLQAYKKMDIEDAEHIFDKEYICKSLQNYLCRLTPDHYRFQ